ncbi:CHASE2 domain-containing sensor protein [Virgibacillus natechei]|uniref:CHASE2 domain-containing sensor protein n=1 Tax=Virgibacillus natechei TaxID=1216297 RepID=A0ABS4IIY8_9BACI|nr:YesK family protein [Virgibacillus natechei]MBP1970930.1 CHASE2 domain-containing sensor protein [Virgibacillus natechei]UZD13308.1 YesK-like family protein [Virgibacillus natechei]
MDALMLEGWTPILLIGIVVAFIIFFISRKISRKALFLISIVLSLICVGIVIYSREAVGGWEGIGLAFVTFSGFLGIWVGTISGMIIKK